MKDIFEDIKCEEIYAGGFRFNFPIRYFDYSLVGAAFPAPADKLQEVLPTYKLKPVQMQPDISTVLFIALENRSIDSLKPYNEFDVMIPVTYESDNNTQGLPGLYCLYLPVTTEEARVGGVEIYGYPKFIADISFNKTDELSRCKVRADEKDIITLEVRTSASELRSYDTYTYTVKGGQLIRTLFQVQGQDSTNYLQGGASYTLGDHPIADELRALQIDRTSVMHRYAPRLKMLIHLPGERLPI